MTPSVIILYFVVALQTYREGPHSDTRQRAVTDLWNHSGTTIYAN